MPDTTHTQREGERGKQLTSKRTCKQKRTYHSNETARRAVKRRNKAAGYNYLRKYQCNVCGFWHVTSQEQVLQATLHSNKESVNNVKRLRGEE